MTMTTRCQRQCNNSILHREPLKANATKFVHEFLSATLVWNAGQL